MRYLFTILLFSTTTGAAQAELGPTRTVALTAKEAPGTGGAHFDTFGTQARPTINQAGEVSFFATLHIGENDVTGENYLVSYREADGSLELLARSETEAPGAEGAEFFFTGVPICFHWLIPLLLGKQPVFAELFEKFVKNYRLIIPGRLKLQQCLLKLVA